MENIVYCTKVLENALKSGLKLHAWRSGGGLRVVVLRDKKQKCKGYGEHPHFEEAIKIAEQDYQDKLFSHYLTGSCSPTSTLDEWILKGHTIDAWIENELFVVQLSGIKRNETPKEVLDYVLNTGNKKRWNRDEFEFETSIYVFANMEKGTSTKCLNPKKDVDYIFRNITKTSKERSLNEAFLRSIDADELIVEENDKVIN